MAKNVRKLQKIAKFQKLLNMMKKLQKFKNNVKQCKKMPKTGQKRPKNGKIFNIFCYRFSSSKLPQKMVLAVFTRCLVPEIQICYQFWLKSAFLGPNFSRTEICTFNPMVVGCVQHYSTHFLKKIGKSLEPFCHKGQKTAKKGQKWQKGGY